jgi:hypothetical protein
MRRGLAWLGGALGLAALWRYLRDEADRQAPERPVGAPDPDPAAELRSRLQQARGTDDDRDEFDAAEGQPVDEAEPRQEAPAPERTEARSLEERRRAIHEKAQQALGEMQPPAE